MSADGKDTETTTPPTTTKKKGKTGPVLGDVKRVPASVIVLRSSERTYRLHKNRVVIGSVISADVRLLGDGVSPIHAVLEVGTTGEAVIYDLASETGVFVNQEKTVTQTLKTNDEITIGKHSYKFSLENAAQEVDGGSRMILRASEGQKLFLNPKEDLSPLLLEEGGEVEEIFDYRPTNKQALEVVMSWVGTILDVEHFVQEREVTIGTVQGSHFTIPPILSNSRYPLVSRSGESFILNLDGIATLGKAGEQRVRGVLQRKGVLQPLESIIRYGGSGMQIPLEKSDFAKISFGDIDFYLSFTAAPPRLKLSKIFDRDPAFLKILSASLLFTAAALFGISNATIPPNLEAEKIPERVATILYQPEKFTPPKIKVEKPKETPSTPTKVAERTPPPPKVDKPKPKPTVKVEIKPNPANINKPVPKEMNVASGKKGNGADDRARASRGQNEAKEGKGARAKGKEGMRGTKTAARGEIPQNKAMRPAPEGGPGRGGGHSQITDEGNVDLLKGADKIKDILGNSAAQLGKGGGEQLKGFGGFDTRGNGGLALSGTGKGGGGDADSLGGLADTGRGGGRVGTGLGAAGSGSGIIGGKTRTVIRAGGSEEGVVMGSIDASAIEAALLAHRDEFRLCYEREINAEQPDLSGRVGTSFVIGSSGRVTQAGISSSSLKNPNAERCILSVIKRIDFPVPRGGGVVQVSYPFKFATPGKSG